MSNMAKPKRWRSGDTDADVPDVASLNVVPIRVEADSDPLDGFAPESQTAAEQKSAPSASTGRARAFAAISACVLVAAAAASAFYVRGRLAPSSPAAVPPPTGRAILNSRPEGATVIVDGTTRGVTPLELDLAVGAHDVVFKADSSERRIALEVETGMRV